MLADSPDKASDQIRNNLAFCQILTGDVANALENATKAMAGSDWPLVKLNRGIAEFLMGNVDVAKKFLHSALQPLSPGGKSDDDDKASYVLVLEPTGKEVSSHADLPVAAAILINLWRMGDSTRGELETELAKLYPEKAQTWLATFIAT